MKSERDRAPNILVVDDEVCIVEEMLEALEDEGYACEGVCSADAALERIRREPRIRLVLTDLKMPGKSGLDLIATVEQPVARDLWFVVLSGLCDGLIDERTLSPRVTRLLRKPLDVDHLLDAVEQVAAERGI